MFIPNNFRFEDTAEKIAFIKQYSFATIVTSQNHIPVATQLPFSIDDSSGKLVLSSHFAAANEQTHFIESNSSLVIFSGPHAYISPAHYDKRESVPTWDYIAVHAYGKAIIIKDELTKLQRIGDMIHFYESGYWEHWKSLPDKYRSGMLKGIVVFDLEVTDLQGQKKLSQNKTDTERRRIADHLDKSANSAEKDIAAFIKNL